MLLRRDGFPSASGRFFDDSWTDDQVRVLKGLADGSRATKAGLTREEQGLIKRLALGLAGLDSESLRHEGTKLLSDYQDGLSRVMAGSPQGKSSTLAELEEYVAKQAERAAEHQKRSREEPRNEFVERMLDSWIGIAMVAAWKVVSPMWKMAFAETEDRLARFWDKPNAELRVHAKLKTLDGNEKGAPATSRDPKYPTRRIASGVSEMPASRGSEPTPPQGPLTRNFVR